MYKTGLRFKENLTIDVLVPSNLCFHPLCHMIVVLNDYHVHACYDLHPSFLSYKSDALGALMAPLRFAL